MWPFAVGAAIVAGVVALVVLGSGGDDSSSKPSGRLVSGALPAVPTNHVRGNGKAELRINGSTAAVTLDVNGLLDHAPHAMHIHAGGAGQCPPASAAKLHNGHRAISTSDGGAFYGHPRTSLTTKGATGPASILAFSRYPALGDFKYKRDIKLLPTALRYIRRNNAVVVVHGIDYNENGLYDGSLDRSELDSAIQGETTAPALCGPIRTEKTASASGGTQVFTASLRVEGAAPVAAPRPLCHLGLPAS